MFPVILGHLTAASEKDEKQMKEYSCFPVPILREIFVNVAITCQPYDSGSWWNDWLPNYWPLQGWWVKNINHPKWLLSLHGMMPFCQPVIHGRTNTHCQISFLYPAGSPSPGPTASKWHSYCQECALDFFPLSSFIPADFFCPELVGCSAESRGTLALPFESLWICSWSFPFCRC